ncbi:hypothetical protein [Sphingomonas jatrophae]|uniref:Uncharacterized protein n=1 Tax=Sphingomonas jatrophae TaxID=1166337 RepID=A0A1I6L4V4_9SPHN|nr:hypothetical protein [Sphingomonas jatrophae]SFR98511.1 hypothetical protein SAMN05192580_2296 [Sphingomonas jatrophae]
MTSPYRTIRGTTYRQFRTVFPGSRLFFVSGRDIAIEHWAYEVGQHEFDYEVNSRRTGANGRPEAIATTRDALAREFMEGRAIGRMPIPLSIGDSDGNRLPEVQMTYGEVAPQLYRSRVDSERVAWSVNFVRHYHLNTQGRIGMGLAIARPNANVSASAARTAAAQNMQSGFNYLMLWIPARDFERTELLPGGFGTMDMIGESPTLYRRFVNWVQGR